MIPGTDPMIQSPPPVERIVIMRIKFLVAVGAILAALAWPATASAATTSPAPRAIPAPAPQSAAMNPSTLPVPIPGTILRVHGTQSISPATSCTPYVDGDTVHVSSGHASGHGWWYRGTCPNQKTTVYMGLQEYWCYPNGGSCYWQTMSTGQKYVWPGGGSANRANARSICQNTRYAGWRSWVIVKIGNGASAFLGFANIYCQNLG